MPDNPAPEVQSAKEETKSDRMTLTKIARLLGWQETPGEEMFLERIKGAIAADAAMQATIERLQHRLDLLGDVPGPHEDTLFGLSAHHTWHHQRENELAWIRKKLELPEDAEMFSGENCIAGAMHIMYAHARGYEKYVAAYKCEDKDGEIARLTVRAESAESRLKEVEAELVEVTQHFNGAMQAASKTIEGLEARLKLAGELAERLPHLADGTPVICDGMTIFCPRGHEHKLNHATGRLYCCKGECWSDGCQGDSGSGTHYQFSECTARFQSTTQEDEG